AEDHFLVVANAANAAADLAELSARAAGFDVEVDDASADTALLAVQGPASQDILVRALTQGEHAAGGIDADDLAAVKNYRVLQGSYRGQELLIARTGYTGEDGFELYLPTGHAARLWQQLTEA